jgi:uncharacterized protein DUF4157
MQIWQDKTHDADTNTEVATPAHKAATDATAVTHVPAWANAGGEALPSGLQAKLTINQPGDVYEQEADRVAEQVMRMPTGGTPRTHEDMPVMRKESSGGQASHDAPPVVQQALSSGGQSLDAGTQEMMGTRFGQDFSHVRVHTDGQASESAQAINARAYTIGSDVVFGEGQYRPETGEGQRLLAHELTHVVQQSESGQERGSPVVAQRVQRRVQGSFFGDLWEGVKSVGRAIGGAAVTVGKAVGTAASAVGGAIVEGVKWVGERAHDVLNWATSLISELPARLFRFGKAIVDGLVGVATFIPEAISALRSGGISGFASWLWEKAKSGGAWLLTLVDRILDLVGGPEIVEFVLHLLSFATPLTAEQTAAGQLVLGKKAIRWNQVRVAQGGIWWLIFWLNGNRAVTTFHTINLPSGTDLPTVVHELTHVYQYERAGSIYIGQAIHAQATEGYEYGDLEAKRKAGKHYRDFNREQQAQIAEDYFKRLTQASEPTTEFDPYIAELRAGDL